MKNDNNNIQAAPTSVRGETGVDAQKQKPEEENIEELQKQIGEAAGGDSVAEDIKSFKNTAKNIGDKLTTAIKPHQQTASTAIKSVASQVVDKGAGKANGGKFKAAWVLGIVVLIVLLTTLWGRRLGVSRVSDNGDVEPTPAAVSEEAPTPAAVDGPFIPANASIYATDSAILKIEETNNILRNEMFTSTLSDPILFPPSLDYNVNFK
jgi:hypothetical protein